MANKPTLFDQFGRPIKRSVLSEEVAAPTLTGVRTPVTGYPGDGLTPASLALILREADAGDPVRYLELAETIEERDPHYLGVLGTRRRAVSQIEITVEPADDSSEAEEDASMIRDWLKRDELRGEMFDILDAIGKGFSFTEIMWDSSMGQFQPAELKWRDPRWFRFERHNLDMPLMLGEHGQEQALPGFKFIFARMQAKSGLPLRSGLARTVLWAYLFKKYTERDWAIFTQTYGQPLRLGRYGSGASDKDKQTLFRAVANIAGDCAAIVPHGMDIEFIEASNVGSSTSLFQERAEWYDKQVSKAVLGQTATTDAETGGLGSGKEHREVQEDIERADSSALAAILNRQLIRPWIDLNRGPQKRYPRLIIARPDEEDLAQWSSAVTPWVEQGLQVKSDEIYDKLGITKPPGAPDILARMPVNDTSQPPSEAKTPMGAPLNTHSIPNSAQSEHSALADPQGPTAAISGGAAPAEQIADRMQQAADPAMREMLEQIESMMEAATSLEELREMMLAGFPDISSEKVSAALAMGMLAAHMGGRAMVEDGASE